MADLVYTPKEVADLLKVPEWTARDEIRKGNIRSIRIGRRVLVPAPALRDYIDGVGLKAAQA